MSDESPLARNVSSIKLRPTVLLIPVEVRLQGVFPEGNADHYQVVADNKENLAKARRRVALNKRGTILKKLSNLFLSSDFKILRTADIMEQAPSCQAGMENYCEFRYYNYQSCHDVTSQFDSHSQIS